MTTIHNLGFPRIGPKRELKFALEKFWQGEINSDVLEQQAWQCFHNNLKQQADLDFQPVGDFSLYDHVLDHIVMFGNTASRFIAKEDTPLQRYFRIARGRAPQDSPELHSLTPTTTISCPSLVRTPSLPLMISR